MGSIPDVNSSDQPGFDETGEVIWPRIGPAQVLATLAAQTVAPGVSRKPSVLQRGRACVPAAQSPRKGDNLKLHSLGVPENEFISAVEGEPILVIGDTVQTPVAQPVTGWILNRQSRLRSCRRNDLRFHYSLRVHHPRLRQQ